MALFWIIAFVLYLRPGEAMSLTPNQLVPPLTVGNNYNSGWGFILGPLSNAKPTKMGEYDQSVLWDRNDLDISESLSRLKKRKAGMRIWRFDSVQGLNYFKSIINRLRLPIPIATFYILRHGGASHDVVTGRRSIMEVKSRGRWTSDRSVRRYSKATRALPELEILPAVWRRYALKVERLLPELLEGKQAITWPPRP